MLPRLFAVALCLCSISATAQEDEPTPVELTAKLGEGVTVRSGDFSLNLRGRFQLQGAGLIADQDSGPAPSVSFIVRRARVILKGEMPHHLSFVLHLGFSANDLESDAPNPIRDLYVQWNGLRDLSIRVGQMKVPFDVQRWGSSSSLQLVDRSPMTLELNLDRDIGLLFYADDLLGWGHRLHYAIGIWQGDGRNRINANTGLLYTARLRVTPFGAMDDKGEGDIERGANFRAGFGASVARNLGTPRSRSTHGIPFKFSTFDYTHLEADINLKWRGFSALSQAYLRQADRLGDSRIVGDMVVNDFSRSAWGWFVQVGAFITDWLELALRYGDLIPLGPTDPTLVRTREIGGGVNVFFIRHDLKLQADYFWLDDARGGDGRHQIRLLAQLYF